jgi:hypothetical protein
MLSKREMGTCEKREGYIHCEVQGAIVNIREGLQDVKGRAVTSVQIMPDDRYAGEPIWKVIPKVYNVRIVQTKKRR